MGYSGDKPTSKPSISAVANGRSAISILPGGPNKSQSTSANPLAWAFVDNEIWLVAPPMLSKTFFPHVFWQVWILAASSGQDRSPGAACAINGVCPRHADPKLICG